MTGWNDLRVYKGQAPYLFVSYAHKDSALVYPLLQALQDAGYRIWFDQGIEAGTEWSNNIAEHLRQCSAFLFFLSSNSVRSENCLDEVAYAKSYNKPALMIYLEEDVVLPAGADMQTARFQRLYMPHQENTRQFLEKFSEAGVFDSCRGTVGETDVTLPAFSGSCAEAPVNAGGVTAASLLKRGQLELEDGKWDSADSYFEKVLDMDPENAQAYLGKLLAEMQVFEMDQLAKSLKFLKSSNYKRLLRFADKTLSQRLQEVEAKAKQEAMEAVFRTNASIKNGVLTSYRGNEKEICIPSCITAIGESAFSGSKNLTRITIPDHVTSIEKDAFRGAEALTAVIIGNGVKYIGDDAFRKCEALTSVAIGNGVIRIGMRAFYGCKALASINIPDSVTAIGETAFYGCEALTEISLPANMTQMGANPFSYCAGLTKITVAEGNAYYHTANGHLVENETKILVCGVADMPIPEDGSVTAIGDRAFLGRKVHTCVVIPKGVTRIGERAFYGCKDLAAIDLPDSVTDIGESAFYGCEALRTVTLPAQLTKVGVNPFANCSGLTGIIVSEGNAYYRGVNGHLVDSRTKTLICGVAGEAIPDDGSIVAIGDRAFLGCKTLTAIAIAEGVTSIGDRAFCDCEALASIIIPGSVIAIGESAFSRCSKLTVLAPIESYAMQWAKKNRIVVQEDEKSKQERLAEEKLKREKLEYMQEKREEEKRRRRMAGLCQHCGGKLKGLFSKKCADCGEPKDY